MNTERILQRIFTLARRTPDCTEIELPFGFESVVIAHWKESVQHGIANGGLLPGLRWGALLACAIALLAAAVESDELIAFKNRFDPEARVADSAVASYDYE